MSKPFLLVYSIVTDIRILNIVSTCSIIIQHPCINVALPLLYLENREINQSLRSCSFTNCPEDPDDHPYLESNSNPLQKDSMAGHVDHDVQGACSLHYMNVKIGFHSLLNLLTNPADYMGTRWFCPEL